MIGKTMRWIGRLWGGTFLRYVILAYTRRRVSHFDLHVEGLDHVETLDGRSYILVSNHVIPRDRLFKFFDLKPLRPFDRFNYAIDSFVFQQIIHERTRRWVRVVAKCGRDHWHASAPLQFLQKHIRQPLTQGQLEGVGYVPVDLKAGAVQRGFLKSAEQIIHGGEALLIFPEENISDGFEAGSSLRGGAAHLAHKHGVPILPAYISGSDSWKPGQRIDVRFGPPIDTQGLSKTQIVAAIKRSILTQQQAMRYEETCKKPSKAATKSPLRRLIEKEEKPKARIPCQTSKKPSIN